MDLSIPYFILNNINRALFDQAVLPEGEIDWALVCKMCKSQSVTGLFWAGLQKSGLFPEPRFIEYFHKKDIQERYQYSHQQQERKRVTTMLEKEKIPYILLKGSRMRQFYPDPTTRTSCDIDILFRGEEKVIHEQMLSFGYEFLVDAGTTINYFCDPVEFEMHRYLFDDRLEFHGFFDKVWEYSAPAKKGSYEYILTEEFFYVYMIAHMAKHFTRYGSGVRPVIDLYLYHRRAPENFDREKAEKILKELGLYDFEQRLKALTKAWFETGKLSEMDKKLTDYILGTGIYGDSRIMNAHAVKEPEKAEKARRQKILFYIFPSMEVMRRQYPNMLKCPALLPAAWVCRWCKGAFTDSRKKAKTNLQNHVSVDKTYVSHVNQMMNELGL